MWDPPATEGGRLYSGGADQILPITFPFQLDAGAWHLPSFSGRTSGRYLLRIAVIPCGSVRNGRRPVAFPVWLASPSL
jgi:hypothetical protein